MTTPAPAQLQGEPFSEALAEAAQAAAMSVRLILTIADAVRRAAQKHHHGQEKELGPDAEELAEGWSAEQLRTVLPEKVLHGLMAGADWPVMARHLASLQHAGVDLATFLPNLGAMASGVERAVAHNAARTKAEGTDRWADLLRRTMPEGLVRDAILASPAWPTIAADMGRLHDQGVDVARILTDAHTAGLGVDQAVAAVTTRAATPDPPRQQAPASAPVPAPAAAPAGHPTPTTAPVPAPPAPTAPTTPAPPPASAPAPAGPPTSGSKPDPWAAPPVPPVSTDAKRIWGPLTEGLTIPRDLDLTDRARALDQLRVTPGAHRLLVSRINQALPQRDAELLVSSRQWPLLAHRMHRMTQQDEPLTAHLARLATDDAAWRTGPPADTAKRLLLATHYALTTPLDTPLPTGPRVSAPAARSRSTTTTSPDTAAHKPAPAAPAHHRQTAPAPRQGRGR